MNNALLGRLRAATIAFAATGALPLTALAQTAAAPRLDDGYTLFELTDTEESENGARVWRGYAVTAHYRVFGAVPSGSAMLTVFKEGGREVGRVRCEGSAHDTSDDPAWQGMTFECIDRAQRIRTVGALTAETTFINGQTDAQTPMRAHSLTVRESSQAGASPQHYVSRHQEVLSGLLTWHTANRTSYAVNGYFRGAQPAANVNTVRIVLPVAGGDETATALQNVRLRCTVGGQPITFADGDQVTDTRGARSLVVTQSVRTPEGGTNNASLGFYQLLLAVPLAFPPEPDTSSVNMAQHPGRWQCDLRNNGEVLRTIAFTVGPNGVPAPHAEQAAGLYFGPRAVLIDVTVPAAGARGERTAPAEARAGGFYGRAWTTDATRAAAAAVPALGEPHLLATQAGRAAGGAAAPTGAARGRGRR